MLIHVHVQHVSTNVYDTCACTCIFAFSSFWEMYCWLPKNTCICIYMYVYACINYSSTLDLTMTVLSLHCIATATTTVTAIVKLYINSRRSQYIQYFSLIYTCIFFYIGFKYWAMNECVYLVVYSHGNIHVCSSCCSRGTLRTFLGRSARETHSCLMVLSCSPPPPSTLPSRSESRWLVHPVFTGMMY